MKRLLLVVSLVTWGFIGGGVASTGCPCPRTPPFACCGDLTCDELRFNAAFFMAVCHAEPSFICCRQNVPWMAPREAARPEPPAPSCQPSLSQQCGPLVTQGGNEISGIAIKIIELGHGKPKQFLGLTNDVQVQQRVYKVILGDDGKPFIVDRDGPGFLSKTGHFKDGFVTWDNGERHRVLGGVLIRDKPAAKPPGRSKE